VGHNDLAVFFDNHGISAVGPEEFKVAALVGGIDGNFSDLDHG
jgi:hypothetical protein